MTNKIILALIIALPIFGSCLLPVAGRISATFRNILALSLAIFVFALGLFIAPSVFSGNIIEIGYNLPFGFNFLLKADAFALFCALASSFVSAIIVFYSFEYIKPYKNQNEYYFIVLLFLGSMMGIIFSANLILLYMFWEMTALASWRLIGFFRKDDFVRRANKAFLVTAGGAFLMLIGFFVVYSQAGSFDYKAIHAAIPAGNVKNLAVILILCGIFAKSATFPFHTWLADAGVAPSPVTALLHAAVLVKIGVYVYARLFTNIIAPSEEIRTVIFIIIALSALLSGGAALIEKDIKRIIAFSTVSQLAFIFLGFVVGTPLAFGASMLYILMHSSAKAGLFLSAGIIEHETHTKDTSQMGGLFKVIPITAVGFLLCMASIIGIPPMGGFFSKFFVITGAAAAGYYAVALVFVLAATLTILYMVRVYYKVFLAAPVNAIVASGHKSSFWSPMNLSISILAFISLVCGLGFGWFTRIAELASKQMFGII
ncbi:NADH-quinone oxidoreductase subunit L [Endomicrobium proavitum]|uniref:NADH:ubiquinone oxidoreductase, membrane subunit L n=1 Tax=Endomicrobium proavitum TaxID=1408281 RepID=A0A0G3WHM6_9BACT|nr:NADH-quinone oxidoreductase subunit L [Endomicrobium proavitum]AKL97410.1 NADH:ubiquinone oxidoreductase, membrane subunit L [Endomicrobium proavitum]